MKSFCPLLGLAAIALLSAPVSGASTADDAATVKTLYDFCGVALCANGALPRGALLRDTAGNIWGTVTSGTTTNGGGVFELTPDGDTWSETAIIPLCAADACPFGAEPGNGVIMDTASDLYGTATAGGGANAGTVFEMIPNKARTKWRGKLLHSFCSRADCTDGSYPNALTYLGQASGIPYDGISPLFGTTNSGGASNGGVAFALTPPPAGKKKWKAEVIHHFCSPNTSDGCTEDGAGPEAGMIMDAAGNLYGTAESAGLHSAGVVFELKPKHNSWSEKVLYNFCSQAGCADGGGPRSPVLMDGEGNLLGSAGDVFKLDPKTLKYTVLHASTDGTEWTLVMDAQSNLYAASFAEGAFERGSVWALDPDYEVLYSFCPVAGCKDGGLASSPPLLASSGSLIGTTMQFGAHGAGNVYELTP